MWTYLGCSYLQCTSIVQFAMVFHKLQHHRHVLEYESMQELFIFLKMSHLNKKC